MIVAVGVIVLVVAIAATVSMARHQGSAEPAGSEVHLEDLPPPPTGANPVLDAALARWVEAELITAAQADAVAAHEAALMAAGTAAAPAPARRGLRTSHRLPLAAEALGYLGGSLSLAGVLSVVIRLWEDFSAVGRFAVAASGTAGLVLVGWLVGRGEPDPALERLRSFAWLAGTGAAGALGVVVARDVAGASSGSVATFGGALAAAVVSALLWQGRADRPIQQATTTIAALVAVAAGAAALGGDDARWGGVALWVVAVAPLVVTLRHRLPHPTMGTGIAALGVILGAMMTAEGSEGGGFLFATATAIGIVALVVVRWPRWEPTHAERIVLALVGGLGLFQTAPATLGWYANEAGAVTGAVVWLVGAGLLATVVLRPSLIRTSRVAMAVASAAVLVGAAITSAQWPDVAPAIGAATAVALIVVGMRPGLVICSLAGAVGLLANVPWAIARWFPGDDRAPLLLMVAGGLILVIAVVLARSGGRLRAELGGSAQQHRPPPPAPQPPG